MKKFLSAVLVIAFAAALCTMFTGCSESDAIWLEDGQTLKIIDNTTAGSGCEGANLRIPYSYKNSVDDADEKGYIFVMPESDTNPTVRYFISINYVSLHNGVKNPVEVFAEITNVKDGDSPSWEETILTNDAFSALRSQMGFPDGELFANTDHDTHYTSTVTTTKCKYVVSGDDKHITVWTHRYLAITVTSPILGATPLSFEIEAPVSKMPLALTQEGDSWEVLGGSSD